MDFWADLTHNELTFGSEEQGFRQVLSRESVGPTTFQNVLRILGPVHHQAHWQNRVDDADEQDIWLLPNSDDPAAQAARFINAARTLGSKSDQVYTGNFPDEEKVILTKNPSAFTFQKKVFFGAWSYNLVHENMGRALFTLCNQRVFTVETGTEARLIQENHWGKEAKIVGWEQANGRQTLVVMNNRETIVLQNTITQPGFSFREIHPVVESNRSKLPAGVHFTPGMTKYGLATYLHLGYKLVVMVADYDRDSLTEETSIQKGYQHEMAQKLGLNRNDFGRA
jgi:hypothetical protein